MKIRIIAVDKIREPFYRDAIAEYTKRITNLEIVEVKKSSGATTQKIIDEEGQSLLKHIKDHEYVIVCDPLGEQMTSEGLADVLKSRFEPLCFVIGGANGLSEYVKKRENVMLSLSQLTFPHELARLILIEQIYRGQSINQGRSYHK